MQDYRDPQGQNNNPYQSEEEIPRWNPSPDDYNTPPRAPQNKAPKRRWLIPLIIVAAVMVISIVVGVVIGLNRIRKEAAMERSQQQAEKIIDVQENVNEAESAVESVTTTIGSPVRFCTSKL